MHLNCYGRYGTIYYAALQATDYFGKRFTAKGLEPNLQKEFTQINYEPSQIILRWFYFFYMHIGLTRSDDDAMCMGCLSRSFAAMDEG